MTASKQMPKAEQLPMVGRRFEQIFHRDHRFCECEMPMTSKKWNDALGTFVVIRLCCMAKTVQKIAEKLGIDTNALYEAFNFDPRWEWDCAEEHEALDENDSPTRRPRGVPPKWLRKRMHGKGIAVKNLPPELAKEFG